MKKKEHIHLPSVRLLRPNLILCGGSKVFDERRGEVVYKNAKFFVNAATSYKRCAKLICQFVKGAAIQTNSLTYSYDSAQLTVHEHEFYEEIHRSTVADVIDQVTEKRELIDTNSPWVALPCPDRSKFQAGCEFKAELEADIKYGHEIGRTLLQKKAHGMEDGKELVLRFGLTEINFQDHVSIRKKSSETTRQQIDRVLQISNKIIPATKSLLETVGRAAGDDNGVHDHDVDYDDDNCDDGASNKHNTTTGHSKEFNLAKIKLKQPQLKKVQIKKEKEDAKLDKAEKLATFYNEFPQFAPRSKMSLNIHGPEAEVINLPHIDPIMKVSSI